VAFAWAQPGCYLPVFFFGQLGMHINERILEFVRDFGLLLFVYTVGLQVGPGFFSSEAERASAERARSLCGLANE
jgi:uncharacterized transporter YbjL